MVVVLLTLIVVVLVVLGGVYIYYQNQPNQSGAVSPSQTEVANQTPVASDNQTINSSQGTISTPNTPPTVGWNVFTSSLYGFQISYPNTYGAYKYQSDDNGGGSYLPITTNTDIAKLSGIYQGVFITLPQAIAAVNKAADPYALVPAAYVTIQISVTKTPGVGYASLEQYKNFEISSDATAQQKWVYSDTTINGQPAFKEIFTSSKGTYYRLSLFKGNALYLLDVDPNSYTQDSATIDAIANSFKFTNSATAVSSATGVTQPVAPTTNTTSTAGWKTYTDSQYGFSFQYPSALPYSLFASLNGTPTALTASSKNNIDSNGCYVPSIYAGTERAGTTDSNITLNKISFCASNYGDPGAGQLYTAYSYTTYRNGNYVTLQYVVHTPNGCGAYQGTDKYQACTTFFQSGFNTGVLQPIQQSVATLMFTQ